MLLLPSYDDRLFPLMSITCCEKQIHLKITSKAEVAGVEPWKDFMLFKRLIPAFISELSSLKKH